MSSFYGGPSVGGGGGGSSDYNDMSNVPIKNITGTSANRFINFAGLDAGHYNLKGYYKKDSQSELQNVSEFIDLTVKTDTVTNKKVIQFFTIEDGVLYSNLIVYNNGVIEKEQKTAMNGQGGEPEIHWGDMVI